MPGLTDITVLKLDLDGEVTWQYEGRVLKRAAKYIMLEAFFDRDDLPLVNVFLKRNDRFVETYFSDRWYNVFEIYDRDDEKFKGWYCNIGFPAELGEDKVSYIDLALDLWVARDGTQTVLDEEEFLALSIDEKTRIRASSALEGLKRDFMMKKPPA